MLPTGVGAAEGCDLLILIFRLGLKCLGKDRSLVALDSSYEVVRRELVSSPKKLEMNSMTGSTALYSWLISLKERV